MTPIFVTPIFVTMKYDDIGVTKPFSDRIKAIHEMKHLRNASDKDKRIAIESIAKLLSIDLFLDGTEYKHSAYKFEEEFRLVIPMTKEEAMKDVTQYVRVRQGEVVHYISRPLMPNVSDSIHSVMVGPAAGDAVIDQLEYLLETRRHVRIDVNKSSIPYRSIRG